MRLTITIESTGIALVRELGSAVFTALTAAPEPEPEPSRGHVMRTMVGAGLGSWLAGMFGRQAAAAQPGAPGGAPPAAPPPPGAAHCPFCSHEPAPPPPPAAQP